MVAKAVAANRRMHDALSAAAAAERAAKKRSGLSRDGAAIALTGAAFELLLAEAEDEENGRPELLAAALGRLAVAARFRPMQKQHLVDLIMDRGYVRSGSALLSTAQRRSPSVLPPRCCCKRRIRLQVPLPSCCVLRKRGQLSSCRSWHLSVTAPMTPPPSRRVQPCGCRPSQSNVLPM